MLEKYNSVFHYFGTGLPHELLMIDRFAIPSYSVEELHCLEREIITQLDAHRAGEPSKKQGKMKYKIWVEVTHDYLETLKIIRDEIAKKSTP